MKKIAFGLLLMLCCVDAHAKNPLTFNFDAITVDTQKDHRFLKAITPRKSIDNPLRIGVIGLVHTHVHWILGREKIGDITIVGIVEPNRELAKKYSVQHGYSMDIVFNTMEEMVAATRPEAVTAFNTIYGHLEVVEFCAPKGIHVMVEKPLAVNLGHAKKMIALAQKHNIHLLTNYETSWYGSSYKAYDLAITEQKVGDLRRIVFHTGHPGPIEIGCNPEFLEWLIDPDLNGGGALTDFGCYGANLATWFMQGEVPEKIYCTTQQLKPELYPEVEDDAILIISYPKVQVIIQASWNWSHNRKDMELYGTTGYVICKNGTDMEVMEKETDGPYALEAPSLLQGIHDPFALLQKVVKDNYELPRFDVSSIENNMIVIQILEAAKHSAKNGETVIWNDFFKD
ncbi:MAG: Gfo/Idh/MocA family oxidoreductase [Saonia sp.]